MIGSRPAVRQRQQRDEASTINVTIIGAGLGGLGAAISILLSGHKVHILEAASQIGEIGAGIQCLPNSSRILISWGMETMLSKYWTRPKQCNMLTWKGEVLSSMQFWDYQNVLGTPFWDFHRANLHRCLLDRALELGATLEVNARVDDVRCAADGSTATAYLQNGQIRKADLIIGADGINSRCREMLLGRPDPPTPTGDLAYRLLLNTKKMMADPDLRSFITDPQVNYWMGPDVHCVNYVLRGGELFNMVLLCPDDMPSGAMTLQGNIDEMRAIFKDWDPRIPKLLALCEDVVKWRLCIREGMPSWSHPSGAFACLGDAVHATLPYLASGAGMSLEDGSVLGLCLGRITSKSKEQKQLALRTYEQCRRARTEKIVKRGNLQQYLYHVPDGAEQRERDRLMRGWGDVEMRKKAGEEVDLEKEALRWGSDPLAWRWSGVGDWLLTYDCEESVETHWPRGERARL